MSRLLRWLLFGKREVSFLGIYQTDEGPLSLHAVGRHQMCDKDKQEIGNRINGTRPCKECGNLTYINYHSCDYCALERMCDGKN